MDSRTISGNSTALEQNGRDLDGNGRRESFTSRNSQTALEFIDSQLQLEADAREVLPYSFDSCTQPLGSLRQTLFSCLTCNPPSADDNEPYNSAAVCYSCSISCHGKHNLVELFSKRNFVCDCGTTRFPPVSPCTLRTNPETGVKGVHSQAPAEDNQYNHNFRNQFCGCGEEYDAHKEKGTMFQCLGLGSAETGGCGEDWWHPECLIGLPRTSLNKTENQKDNSHGEINQVESGGDEDEMPLPPGFPGESDFETFICYKCLDSNPWLKRYAGTPSFLPPVYKDGGLRGSEHPGSQDIVDAKQRGQTNCCRKRKGDRDDPDDVEPETKRMKQDDSNGFTDSVPEYSTSTTPKLKHDSLPPTGPSTSFSLFVKDDFRERLCRCPDCFPNLIPYPQLREEEQTYEPPLSEDGEGANAGGSQGTGSLLDRGEVALSNMDRVRAIEGVMVYNHLRDKVKEFLRPFAESGQPVGAEDIKAYFEKLRGDDLAIREASGQASTFASRESGGDGDNDNAEDGNHRKEQSGY